MVMFQAWIPWFSSPRLCDLDPLHITKELLKDLTCGFKIV
jgi:hypothetical protein